MPGGSYHVDKVYVIELVLKFACNSYLPFLSLLLGQV